MPAWDPNLVNGVLQLDRRATSWCYSRGKEGRLLCLSQGYCVGCSSTRELKIETSQTPWYQLCESCCESCCVGTGGSSRVLPATSTDDDEDELFAVVIILQFP